MTVRNAAEFHDDVTTNLNHLERGEPVETSAVIVSQLRRPHGDAHALVARLARDSPARAAREHQRDRPHG